MILGYQIISNDGKNELPGCFFSFEIIEFGVAEAWLHKEKKNPEYGEFRWVLLPIFDGEIEEPTIISTI